MLVGREKEIEKLNEMYNSGAAELVALYGRRRVGKTYLIDEVCEGRFSFRHAGLSPVDETNSSKSNGSGRMKEQLQHFYHSLLMHGMQMNKKPESWIDAFFMLENYLTEIDDGKSRQLVFFDEIQWLDSPRSGFMTAFEAFWNNWACHRKNIMVIVCGSSTSWILDRLINNHGGLYGRVTNQIYLKPFSLVECEELFKSRGVVLSRYDMALAYMTAGGIPYYLQFFDKGLSLAQNIDALFFKENAVLADEYDRLFSSLFVNPETMKAIIAAINTKNRGLTRQEIIELTGIPNSGELSKYLAALISGNFITRYSSFGNCKRDVFYKLIDPFCIFYLRFVKDKDKTNWINIADTQAVKSWNGFAFENLCFNHIDQIKKALGISGVTTAESLWSKRGSEDERGAQIDLIIDRRDDIVNMCECKFYSDEFAVNKDYHFTLVRRKEMLGEKVPKKKAIHNTLITTYGLKHNEYYGDFTNTITLDDLFVYA